MTLRQRIRFYQQLAVLTRAGVPLELHVYPGAYHAFDVLSDGDLARTKHRDSVAALRHALHSAR